MTSELYVAAKLPDKATTFRKSNPTIKLKLTVIVFAVISLTTYSMFQAMTTMIRWSFGGGRGLFSSLQHTAKNSLSRGASSVPVESMFSTVGLLLNGKRSTPAPHRAKCMADIHSR